ncbi:MAG TPA: acetoin utilization protein AcuC [Steroidobacteraceae bacterium]
MVASAPAQQILVHCSNGAAAARAPALFVASDFCRRPGFGRHHPLSIPRVSAVLELCASLGWVDGRHMRTSRVATAEELARYHDPDYIEALRASDAAGCVDPAVRERHGFGNFENPLFPGVFERAATAVGGSILAAELALEGRVAFHPAGGTHHGRRDRASGFCYFNDPVFAIGRLLEGGISRVLYVDLDAHHGDGVQEAFLDEPRVRVVSIHERGRWPHSGAADDVGRGYACNLPVPAGFNDSELEHLLESVVLPFAAEFAPQAVVVTCGTDALAGDPLSGLALSNVALWDAVDRVIGDTGPAVVLGGGGYNPWTLARCWTGLWGRLRGLEMPDGLPVAAQRILRSLECDLVEDDDVDETWFRTLADAPRSGAVREEVKSLARRGRALHGMA